MKLILIFLFAILQTPCSCSVNKDVFILAGQSNMVGMGGVVNDIWDGVVPPECQSNPRILRLGLNLKWEEAREPLHKLASIDRSSVFGVGPGMPFANSLLKREPNIETIGLVPCAISGSPISSWCRGCPYYTNMVARARAAVSEGGVIRAFLWYQGETDSKTAEDTEAYRGRLLELFDNVRADLNSPNLPIVQVALASGFMFKEKIRDIQLETNVPNVKCVDADGLPLINPDNLHLTTGAQVKLGTMLADKYLFGFNGTSKINGSSSKINKKINNQVGVLVFLLFLAV